MVYIIKQKVIRGTTREAEAIIEQYQNKPTTEITISEAARLLYTEKWRHLSDGWNQTKRLLEISKIIGDPPLAKINQRHIAKIKKKLLTRFAPTTVNRYMSHLRYLMNYARRVWSLLIDTPTFRFRWNEETAKPIRVIEDHEERILLETLNDHPDYAEYVQLLLDTGMRLGESLMIRYGRNIDLSKRLIILHPEGCKPRNKGRSIPMTDRVYTILAKRQKSHEECPWILTRNQLEYRWAQTMQTLINNGVITNAWTIHDLRRTCAVRLFRAGMDIYEIKTWMGHTSIKTTMRYLHVAHQPQQ